MKHIDHNDKIEIDALIDDLAKIENRLAKIRVFNVNYVVSDDPKLMFHVGGDLRSLFEAESHLTSVRNLLRTLSHWDYVAD